MCTSIKVLISCLQTLDSYSYMKLPSCFKTIAVIFYGSVLWKCEDRSFKDMLKDKKVWCATLTF